MSSNFATNLGFLCGYHKSISEICRRLDINRTQFNRYLYGGTMPSRNTLRRICDFFGVEEYEIVLPPDQLANITSVRSANAFGTLTDSLDDGRIKRIIQSSSQDLSAYAGFYLEYYYSMSVPGNILRSLISLSVTDGRAWYRRVEKFGNQGGISKPARCKYLGVAFYLKDRIFLIDYEMLTGNEISETILFPSYKNRITQLIGLKIGVSSGARRDPACSRVLWEHLGRHVDLRKALGKCGLFAPDSDEIDPSIREAIDNSTPAGASLFLAKLR